MIRFLLLTACALALLPPSLCAAQKNVLLLVSDNHTRSDLGCYGHPHLKTPNLDALAARGTRFLNAYATTASCGPSRAVIYTGLLTHANGQFMHAHSFHNGVLAKGVTTIFDLLKNGGYRTAPRCSARPASDRGQASMKWICATRASCAICRRR